MILNYVYAFYPADAFIQSDYTAFKVYIIHDLGAVRAGMWSEDICLEATRYRFKFVELQNWREILKMCEFSNRLHTLSHYSQIFVYVRIFSKYICVCINFCIIILSTYSSCYR